MLWSRRLRRVRGSFPRLLSRGKLLWASACHGRNKCYINRRKIRVSPSCFPSSSSSSSSSSSFFLLRRENFMRDIESSRTDYFIYYYRILNYRNLLSNYREIMEMKNCNFINDINDINIRLNPPRLNIFFFYSCSTNRLIDYSFCSIF